MSARVVTYLVELFLAGTWIDISSDVVDDGVRISGTTSSNSDNPLASGEGGDLSAEVTVKVARGIATPIDTPIRMIYSTAGSAATKTFVGVVTSNRGSLNTSSLSCASARERIHTTRVYSLAYYRRFAFTQTSAGSVEDPDEAGYQAGLGNWGLWMAGGRPLEQDDLYPDAVFYYSIPQNALLAPEYSWLAGESTWDELQKLAAACGGQLYVARDGVVRFIQPLSYPSGTALFTFSRSAATYDPATSGWFGPDSTYRFSNRLRADRIICPFEWRAVRPLQEVVTDDTIHQCEPGIPLTIVLEPKWPLWSLQYAAGSTTQLDPQAIVATFYNHGSVPQGASGYTHTVEFAAQRIVITITNMTSRPFQITKIKLSGEPIVAGEPSSVTVDRPDLDPNKEPPTRTVADGNPFVQTYAHAAFLAALTLAIDATERMLLNLVDCPPDVLRVEGETVLVTCPEWDLSAVPFLITGVRRDDTNGRNSYDLVSVAGLPTDGDFFIVGSTNYAGLTRQLIW